MTLRILPLLFVFSGTFCSSAATLKGLVKPAPDARKAYLFVYLGDQLKLTDSADLKKGEFRFDSPKGGFPIGMYKAGISLQSSTTLILGSEDVKMEVSGKEWENAKLSGGGDIRLFLEFRELNASVNRERQILNAKYQNLLPLQKNQALFNQEVGKLQKRLDSIIGLQQSKFSTWSQRKDAPFLTKVIRMQITQPEGSAADYITAAQVLDAELQRADVWGNRVNAMMQFFGQGDPDRMAELGNMVLALAGDSKEAREILYRAVARALQPLAQQDNHIAYQIAKRYNTEFPGMASTEFLSGFQAGPPSIGEMAPEITLSNREGIMQSLSNLRGKVVLIDFWASWCGPCRHENPVVVKAWKRFEPKGFTVFSVSLDQSKEKWLAAITKDGLAWDNHVSDLRGWQSAGAAAYGVHSIPATFLIDKDGKIVGKNLRGDALEEKLEELLGP